MHIKGFLRLLKKYREDTIAPGARELMDRWYEMIGEESGEISDKNQLKERIWDGVMLEAERRENEQRRAAEKTIQRKGSYLGVAATVLILILGGYVYFGNTQENVAIDTSFPESEEWVSFNNTSDAPKEIFLSDGSRIILEPGSSLRYPAEFEAGERSVYIEGNGLFEITKDAERPFFAHSQNVVVRVLGTSFTIKAIGNASATEVAVLTGKVQVAQLQTGKKNADSGSSKIVLTPNKKATFFKDTGHYITGLVENPVIIERTRDFLDEEAFVFDEAPLSQILDKLEKAYGVDIEISNESVLNCLITADLSSDNLYGKLELISAVLNGKYEINGNIILLSGGVCNVF